MLCYEVHVLVLGFCFVYTYILRESELVYVREELNVEKFLWWFLYWHLAIVSHKNDDSGWACLPSLLVMFTWVKFVYWYKLQEVTRGYVAGLAGFGIERESKWEWGNGNDVYSSVAWRGQGRSISTVGAFAFGWWSCLDVLAWLSREGGEGREMAILSINVQCLCRGWDWTRWAELGISGVSARSFLKESLFWVETEAK